MSPLQGSTTNNNDRVVVGRVPGAARVANNNGATRSAPGWIVSQPFGLNGNGNRTGIAPSRSRLANSYNNTHDNGNHSAES